MPGLLMPVRPTSYASFESHTRRNPRSTEPGTDMFVPIGTPVVAPADGRIYGFGDSIKPFTGRWVGIEFDNGMSFRCMHHSRLTLSRSFMNNRGFVRAGQTIALSGASGYEYEDWSHLPSMPGAHTHVTLWETWVKKFGYRPNGRPWSIDFMEHVASASGGGTGEEDDMTPEESQILRDIKAMLYAGGPSASKDSYLGAPGTIYNLLKKPVQRSVDGKVKSIPQIQDNADTNTMVRALRVQVTGLDAAVKALAMSQGADPAAVLKAVQDGVKAAMRDVTFTADVDG